MKWTRKNRQQLRLRIGQSIAFSDFPDFKEFLEYTENFLRNTKRSIVINAKERITDELPEEQTSALWEDYGVEIGQFEKTFPQILKHSLFITLMSMAEDSITTLCGVAWQAFNLEKEFDQSGPKVINRGIEYLKNPPLSIDMSEQADLIEFVDSLRKLRNCIVHSRGRVDFRKKEEERELREFVASTPTLKIDNFEKIVMIDGFIDESTEKTKTLIQWLFRSVEKKLV